MGKKPNTVKTEPLLELFYMTPKKISAKDMAELFKKKSNFIVQLWENMGVVELELGEKECVDFEKIELEIEDSGDKAFIKNRNIETVFTLSLSKKAFELAKKELLELLEEFEGFICTDSNNFQPIYTKKELE